jgi:ATP-dependent exoDNAse (exonuclease V) beta subunit
VSDTKNLRLLASAGTGKTFRLTNRFLGLLLAGVEPERVLATTFTRKAAGEILDRVFERLIAACESEEKAAKLAEELRDSKDLLGAAPGREACRDLVARLARRLNAFRVQTIDSFFVEVVRCHALDLGLPPGWSIADDRVVGAQRGHAASEVLVPEKAEALVVILRELARGAAQRSVHDRLMGTVAAYRPVHLEGGEESWQRFDTGDPVDDGAFAKVLLDLENAELPTTKAGKPDTRWAKAVATVVEKARAGAWDDLIGKGLIPKHIGREPYYGAEVPEALGELLDLVVLRSRQELVGRINRNNAAASALLEEFEVVLERLRGETGAFGFEDLPYTLVPRDQGSSPLEERGIDLWYRLDGRTDHLLLDEFQDTSPVQWRILENLAEEIVSQPADDRSLLVVGDVKQSIYAFRQAESQLLARLEERLPGLDSATMAKSYRSSGIVLDTVNLVFGRLVDNPVFQVGGAHLAAARRWTGDEGFPTHESALTEQPGVVHVVEAPEDMEGEPRGREVCRRVVERVRDIHESSDGRARIGVLLRAGRHAPWILSQLSELGIDATGEGGTPLTDSRAVLVLLSLLHLADHPDDAAAAFHVASSPLGELEEFAPLRGEPRSRELHAGRREVSRRLRRRLSDEGLGALTSWVGAHVLHQPGWSDWDRARFTQLLDLAHQFEAQREPRISAFLDHVRVTRVESPGHAAVRVMTIHASKGLEFDAVVLPLFGDALSGQSDRVLFDRADPYGPVSRATVAPNEKVAALHPDLEELFEAGLARRVEDGLCVLYVAMTRARRRLDLVLPPPPQSSKSPRADLLVRAALPADEVQGPDEAGVLWTSGDAEGWAEGLEEELPEVVEPVTDLGLAPGAAPRRLERRSPSSQEGGGLRSAREVLGPHRAASLGTLVHACFEGIEWIEDFDLAAGAHLEHRELRRTDAASRTEAARVFEAALEREGVRAALSRASFEAPAGAELEVLAEERFAQVRPAEEGEALWSGAIDRLVLARVGGEVVLAEVLDFKSDDVSGEALEERVEYYRPQLESYRELVCERHGLAAEQVRARLLFVRSGEVREV